MKYDNMSFYDQKELMSLHSG